MAGMPGILRTLCRSADVTRELERGFWPSFNVPYFPDIYEYSGYPAVAARLAAREDQDYSKVWLAGLYIMRTPEEPLRSP